MSLPAAISKKPFWLVHAVFALLIGVVVFFYTTDSRKTLSVFGQIADFSLVEKSGRAVTKESLKGRSWIASFIFTRCRGQCLVMNRRTKDLHRALKNTLFVSFSSDPDFDSPEVLRQYAERFDAEDNWLFLTGNKQTVNTVAVSLKLSRIDEPMMHSTSFILIDGEGNIRGYYDSNDDEAIKRLKADSRRL